MKKDDQKVGTTLIEKESVETGSVSVQVYIYYAKYLGLLGVLLGVGTQMIYNSASIGTNFWLNIWANDSLHDFCFDDVANSTDNCRNLYLGVYGGIGLLQAFAVMILTITLSITTLNGSRLMHKALLNRVLKGPMGFFDTTPLGRIVNRYASLKIS